MTGLMWKRAAADKDGTREVEERHLVRSGIAEIWNASGEVAQMSLPELLYFVLLGDGRVTG